jgi:tetratricopeptide (TPR) repeat protein
VLETGKIISQQQWAQWMENPSLLNMEDLEKLLALQSQFPWFSSVNKYIAYIGKKENLSQFQRWNQHAALTSSNNFELFDLMNRASRSLESKTLENISSIEENNPNPFTPSVNERTNEVTHLATQVLESEVQNQRMEEEEWTIIPIVDAPPVSVDDKVTIELESTKPEVQNNVETPTPIDLGELGNDIMSKAISSSIELEVSDSKQTVNHIDETLISADWGDDFLNFIAGSIGEKITPENSIEQTNVPDQKLDVIEQFIRTEPQIARGRLMDFDIGNMAKESLEEDYNLVTETMAKLYVKQGKIEKARKAYKKLIELFPEKSIYFATQLKNLNKKNQ